MSFIIRCSQGPTCLCGPATEHRYNRRIRGRFERRIREAQNAICAAVEAEDGKGKFREDAWCRPGGGGGVSRVLQVLMHAVSTCARVCQMKAAGQQFTVLTQQGVAACLQAAGHALWAQARRRSGSFRQCMQGHCPCVAAVTWACRPQDGGVWEKAGVGVSVVYGTMPPEAYRAARGAAAVKSPNGNGVR